MTEFRFEEGWTFRTSDDIVTWGPDAQPKAVADLQKYLLARVSDATKPEGYLVRWKYANEFKTSEQQPVIGYSSAHIECDHAGTATWKSSGTRQSTTVRCDCPWFVRLSRKRGTPQVWGVSGVGPAHIHPPMTAPAILLVRSHWCLLLLTACVLIVFERQQLS